MSTTAPDFIDDPEYQAFLDDLALQCDAEDAPCETCLAGGVCDARPPRLDPLWDCGLDDDDLHDNDCD